MDSFQVIGASHHTAGVELRERLALAPADIAALLEAAREADRPIVPLSTCNRAELYWWGDGGPAAWFRDRAGATDASALIHLHGREAARHLFSVAAGLESQVVGEVEILHQVRRAYDAARAAGTTSRRLDTIFSAALTAGRRVRRDTTLGRHPASVSGTAIRLAEGEWGGLAGRAVVVLGAGEAAEGVLRALDRTGASIAVVNRDPGRAGALAGAWGVTDIRPWDGLAQAVAGADLIIAATAAAHTILPASVLAAAAAARPERNLMVVDLCVPRNVDPAARDLPGVRLLDLDDLRARYCPVTAAGAATLRDAEQIVDDELDRLEATLRGRAAAPQLAELRRLSAQLAEEEATRVLNQLIGLTEEEQAAVRAMADRLVRRVMYPVSRAVRGGEAELGARSSKLGTAPEIPVPSSEFR